MLTTATPAQHWLPQRALFTPDALAQPHGQAMHARLTHLQVPIEVMKANRLVGLRGEDERDTYRKAKRTLAVVNAPPSAARLQPIPPSADWQFHLAEGCPAHCQYCYLAGSLTGPPIVRAFANLPTILEALPAYEDKGQARNAAGTSFEASCYTDPLSIEHLTGSLAACITWFGQRTQSYLRFVTKFDAVEPLLSLAHNARTRARFSVNALHVTRQFEAGAPPLENRLQAALQLHQAGYPLGLVVAPIYHFDGWQQGYSDLFTLLADRLGHVDDLTLELITHRFTPGSKQIQLGWYPATRLDLSEETRAAKRNKFGGTKWVYPKETMSQLRTHIETQIQQ